jgi:hypothetical protein
VSAVLVLLFARPQQTWPALQSIAPRQPKLA